MKEKLKFISNNLKSYRVRAGLSQDEMADKLGISRATYCDYEVNPQRVRIEIYKRISDIVGCKLSDFFVELNVTNSDR